MRGLSIALAFLAALAPRAHASKLDGRLLTLKQHVARQPRIQGVSAAAQTSVRFLMTLAPGARMESLAARHAGLHVGSQLGPVVTASGPLSLLDELEADGDVVALEADRKAHTTNDIIRSSSTNGALLLGTLKNGLSDLGTLDGTGVIVGVVDTGIDWTHADFKSGGLSRVVSIWDQTNVSGTGVSCGTCPPSVVSGSGFASFNYGTEFLQAQLNANIGNANCTSVGGVGCPITQRDQNGHGTNVAGIAAGNGAATGGVDDPNFYSGLAPKAQLIIVKTNQQNTGILDAIKYIQTKAGATPFVINLSLGENSGPHDGTDSFDTGVDAVAVNHPIAVAMGNDQEGNPHAQNTFGAGSNATFSMTNAGTEPPPFGGGILQPCLNSEYWHPTIDSYTVTVAVSCSGTCPSALGPINAGNSGQVTVNGVTITIQNDLANNGNGDSQIFVQVEDHGDAFCNPTGSQIVQSISVSFSNVQHNGTGKVDGYTDPSLSGTQFTTFVQSNGTLTEPATAKNVVSVAAYTSKKCWPATGGPSPFCDNTVSPGQIAGFSDHGPTRDGRQKPEIAAPGEYVASSKSKDYSPAYPNVITDNAHTIFHGTSQASPAAAGALALRLQTTPSATVSQLKTGLENDGRSDADTGGTGSGNFTWGFGKMLAPPLVQSAPGGLAVTGVGTSSIAYSWSLVNDATSYSVFYASATTSLAASVVSPLTFSLPEGFNVQSAVQVCGVNATGKGPCSTSVSTVTLPAGVLNPITFSVGVTTIGVTYPACLAGTCAGYLFQASPDPNFIAPVFSSATQLTSVTHLEFPPGTLSPLTNYFMRVGTLNSVTTSSMTSIGSTTTLTNIVAPGLAPQGAIGATSIVFNWTSGGNSPGTTYTAIVSSVSNFSSGVQTQSGVDIFSATFNGLLVDTSYYFNVSAAAGPVLSSGPVSTLAVPPTAASPAFSNVTLNSLRLLWSSGADPPGALYQTQISVSPTLIPVFASSITHNTYADFSGLSANVTYYAQAQTIANGGAATAFAALGATSTLAQPLLPAAVAFTSAFSTGFTANFINPSNPAGTLFLAQISTSVDFGVVAGSSQTYNTFATFSSLIPNQTYYFAAAALNNNGVASSTAAFFNPVAIATVAIPSAPSVVAPVGSTQTLTGLFANWGAGGNVLPSPFAADAALDLQFQSVAQSSTTRNLYAGFSGLTSNTSYYLRVKTLDNNSNGPPSPTTFLGFASTLPNPPGVPAQPFVSVTFASVTMTWNGLPAAPPMATCEGYRLQASLDPGFGTIAATADFPFATTKAGLAGLASSTTYYVRVGAIGFDGSADFAALGSTITAPIVFASATVTNNGAVVSIAPGGTTLTQIQVLVPPGVLPTGTVVTVSPSVASLPPPGSSEANMTPIGSAATFDLNAGGLQPNGLVQVLLTYDPTRIPAGIDPNTIKLARYDPSSGGWTLQSSFADVTDHVVVGQVGHFSLFQPFAVAAAPDLSSVNIFPIPWEPTSSNASFNGPFVTISNLPANSRVRIFTITGELIWENTAGASGVVAWAGNNNWGRKAASGTYLVVIQGGGQTVTKRVVVVR